MINDNLVLDRAPSLEQDVARLEEHTHIHDRKGPVSLDVASVFFFRVGENLQRLSKMRPLMSDADRWVVRAASHRASYLATLFHEADGDDRFMQIAHFDNPTSELQTMSDYYALMIRSLRWVVVNQHDATELSIRDLVDANDCLQAMIDIYHDTLAPRPTMWQRIASWFGR